MSPTNEIEWVGVIEAAHALGVKRQKISELIAEKRIKTRQSERDRRKTLVDLTELRELLKY